MSRLTEDELFAAHGVELERAPHTPEVEPNQRLGEPAGVVMPVDERDERPRREMPERIKPDDFVPIGRRR